VLEGLDQVDWDRLGHAYGRARDVPDQLRALASPDAETRGRALWSLYGNIFHQGTRYEATAYAVPFLLELLADPETPDPVRLLGLVTAIAIGYDESWLPDGVPVAEARGWAAGGAALLAEARQRADEDDDPDDDPDDDEADDDEANDDEDERAYAFMNHLSDDEQARVDSYLALAAYDAVRAGVGLFASLADDADPAVRTAAGYAMAWFPEEAATSGPALTRLARDPDEVVAATAVVALGLVGVDQTEPADPERPLVRLAAALARVRARRHDAEPEVVAELLAWTRRGDARREGFPFLDGDVGGYATLALRQAGADHDEAAFEALLHRIPLVSGTEALPVVGEALRRAFPDGALPAGTPFHDLTQPQRRLVTALSDSPSTWRLGEFATFGNLSLLIGEYGLPRDAEDMREYAQG